MEKLPSDILDYEIPKYLNFKELIKFAQISKNIKDKVENNKKMFDIINTSNIKTDYFIKEINKIHKMDTNKYTYFVSEKKNKVFFVYIPNVLKQKFINSKVIICEGNNIY
jgi:hypothetical protein